MLGEGGGGSGGGGGVGIAQLVERSSRDTKVPDSVTGVMFFLSIHPRVTAVVRKKTPAILKKSAVDRLH